jgi:glycerophosphoryl diester phosphodiesterase
VLLLGHRGARVHSVPENSLAAFHLALNAGCDGFEFDLRRTKDGEAVVCHDSKLHGLSVARRPYEALVKARLRKVSSGKPGSIALTSAQRAVLLARLQDVLAHYADRAFLNLELKVPDLEKNVIALLQSHPPRRGYVVSSFHPQILKALHRRARDLSLGLICDSKRQLAHWPELPVLFVIPHHKLLTQKLIQELHAAGKQVFTWTVNSERVMHRAAELGVDGVLSDDPILLARTLGRNRISHDTSSSETISIGD